MKIKKVLKASKRLIALAKVPQAIDTLYNSDKLPKQVKIEILLISNRFYRIYQDLQMGILTYDEYSIENNKLARSLILQLEESYDLLRHSLKKTVYTVCAHGLYL